MNPTLTIVGLTLLESRRRRILLASVLCAIGFIVFFAAALLIIGRSLPEAGLRRQGPMVGFTMAGLYVANVLTMITAALLAVNALSAEIESGAIQTLAVRPLSRAAIVLGKWIAFEIVLALYVVMTAGGLLLAGRFAGGVVVPNVAPALALMFLGATVMLTVSLALGTRLSAIATGIVAFGVYGIGFLGGWIEQIGTGMPIEEPARIAARNIGTVAGLISPTDVLWRLAAFWMLPPIARALPNSPFASHYPPSPAMVIWALGYVAVVLVWALRIFNRRAL